MLTSLGLLVRTTTKIKGKELESHQEQISRLEMEIRSLQADHNKVVHGTPAGR
jgi:uncharacterized protein (UPF0335 family)